MFRPALATLACAAVACGGGGGALRSPDASPHPPAAASSTPPSKEARAPFVVAIVVDQLSAWSADARIPNLPPGGLFARLTREGVWVHSLRLPYAITDTAPGHASLHTGRFPAESGVTINETPDPATGHRVSVMRDASTKLVTEAGVSNAVGCSSAHMLVETVADRLREAHPRALVLSVSLKDRAALLPAGKAPTHAIWFDAWQGSFVTTTAIESTLPKWAVAAGGAEAIGRLRAKTWTALDEAWLARHAGVDAAPGEGDIHGLGTTFPHVVKTPQAFRATPMSDEAILGIALGGIVAEHDPKEPTLLLLSMSASDVIGHAFGPDSWEAWDHFRRLDAALGAFLTDLEARVGPVSVMLSADHGGVSMPEARLPLPASCGTPTLTSSPPRDPGDPYDRPRCVEGERLEPDELRAELRAEAAKVLGPGEWFTGIGDGYVFLTPAARALSGKRRDLVTAVVDRVFTVKRKAAVEKVFDVRDLAKRCPDVLQSALGAPERARPGEDVETLVCRSWRPSSVGDYYVVPRYGSFFDGEVVPGKGSSHGTPHLYDRTVPLFVRPAQGARGPGGEPLVQAGLSIDDPVDFTAFAAIEASLLGLERSTPAAILDAMRAPSRTPSPSSSPSSSPSPSSSSPSRPR